MNFRLDNENDMSSAEELAARKARLAKLKEEFTDEVNPYVSALVHRDGDKVHGYVPAESLVAGARAVRRFSFLGMFSIDLRFDLRQPVNQWLAIALLGCITVVVLIYYFTNKALAIVGDASSLL